MKKLTLAFLAALSFAIVLLAPPLEASMLLKSPLPPAQTFTSSTTVPFDIFIFIPCALGGVGEEVHLSGNLHVLYHFTLSSDGTYMVESHYQPQGVSGVGLSSGKKYQATGVTSDHFKVSGLPYEETYINNFRIIGQGAGNNFLVHETFHVTINADGSLTALVDNFRSACK